ncbi:ABC transporter ATP-binding protein [Shinella sp. 838]|jgi:ABC-type sugar transport system ATPase subunit|uniref:ABC transporter ATP-binding protein n=1 Tax=unclassified Shinella TaxID=2643062 RepID=UPI00241502BE|nr:ABC transporter ATP-binding protein [Shinella sp. 838]MCA0344426.1 ABC transporter ATP-binding protein [Pseudomonadota bacterium]MDG4672760.1 ABC transporter ATP-binding protein [Shinella sp. 838]
MTTVEIRELRKSYGSLEIIRSADLAISSGEFVVLVGPSGCGKSTLLRCIAGLEPISGGTLAIDGEDMTAADPVKRGVAMVFQSYALYPHMTVAENIGFGLKIAGTPKPDIRARVIEVAKLLKLEALLDRKPKALSGGQRQRVAIGRALARNPRIFLFDEPLSNLDASLRGEMRVELAKLHAKLGNTMIYVTHDQVEAMTLADRMVVMRQGIIEQVGAPLELFNNPINRFVAGFLGQPPMNFIRFASAANEGRRVTGTLPGAGRVALDLPPSAVPSPLEGLELGVRPEDMTVSDGGELSATVEVVEQLGGETIVYGRLADGQALTAKLAGQAGVRAGDRLSFTLAQERLQLFDAMGRNLRYRMREAGAQPGSPVERSVP